MIILLKKVILILVKVLLVNNYNIYKIIIMLNKMNYCNLYQKKKMSEIVKKVLNQNNMNYKNQY
jgi:translation elongation factor EF-1alpha